MKKSNILLVIVMVALQGFFACKSDDISLQPPPQKNLERIHSLIETNHWQAVEKPMDESKIIFLNDVGKASQFFEKMKNQALPTFGSPKPNPLSNEMVLARGIFTFLNGEDAHINFETSMEGRGEILDINLGGSKITYTQNGNYVEIYKWGTIALPMYQEEFIELGGYQYYYVPVATYKAFLENNGWSSVQYLINIEQANFEGNGGTWEAFYLNRKSTILPKITPLIPNYLTRQIRKH
jgi:hypothetical protein